MKKDVILSFCIPTFNRCFYLIDSTKDIISQARALHIEDQIEFCISDNASTDDTKSRVLELKNDNPDIRIVLNFNGTNIGPDLNFEKALSISSGKYTILKGDDDYFRRGGLEHVFNLLKDNPQIGLFISDVEMIDTNRKFVGRMNYLREKKEKLIVNFTNEAEARSYFTLCTCVHALGSFISGVIINSDAFKGVEIDKSFIGTAYAFEYYFWKYLLEGHLMLYSNDSYIEAVVGTSNVWSTGVKRNALDIGGFAFIAEYFFKNSPLKQDFMNVANRMYDNYPFIPIDQRRDFKKYLIPALEKSNHPHKQRIIRSSRSSYLFAIAAMSLLPSKIVDFLLKKRRNAK